MSRILLLETDRFMATNIAGVLEANGHVIDWQVDPQEAIISVDVQPVDLIISELILAGRSGVEFLYELRSYPDWQDMPVIIYTNVPPREVGVSAQGFSELKIDAYHHKCSTPLAELLRSVESCLSPAAA
jgi:DNA-binding response OmpR family regulator